MKWITSKPLYAIILMLLVAGSLTACGHRVPLPEAQDRQQDSLAY